MTKTGVDQFVLKNASVQLTIAEGRITSLYDVSLEWVIVPLPAISFLTKFYQA